MQMLKTPLLLALVLMTVLCPAIATAEDTKEEIAVKIGDDVVITQAEVDRQLGMVAQSQMMRARMQGVNAPIALSADNKNQILNSMIDAKLLYLQAQSEGVAATDEEVAAQIEQSTAQLTQQGRSVEDVLKSQNLTMDELKTLSKQQLTLQRYTQDKAKAIEISDEDLNAKYEEIRESGNLDTASVSHILAKVPDDKLKDEAAWAEKKKVIDEAHKRVTSGEDFGTVAKEMTDDEASKENGGTYEGVQRGRMVPEFDKLTFELEPGKVSDPFRTQYGWHILVVNERTTTELSEIKDRLVESMQRVRMGEEIEKIIEAKRAETEIEILAKFEDDQAPAQAGSALPQGDAVVIQ